MLESLQLRNDMLDAAMEKCLAEEVLSCITEQGGKGTALLRGFELHELMRHPELDFRLAAVRILETRKLLVDTEFNWDAMNANAREGVKAESVALNKLYLSQLAECTESEEFCDAEAVLDDGKRNGDDWEGGESGHTTATGHRHRTGTG